jgi:hypothetical protein
MDMGVKPDQLPTALAISDKLEYPLLRLQSIAVGSVTIHDDE